VEALDITVLSIEHRDCFVDIVELEILFMSARIMSYYAHRLWLEKFGVKRKMNNSVNNKLFFYELGETAIIQFQGRNTSTWVAERSLFSGSTYMDVQTFVSADPGSYDQR
jgi:hypothetical protein